MGQSKARGPWGKPSEDPEAGAGLCFSGPFACSDSSVVVLFHEAFEWQEQSPFLWSIKCVHL